MNWEIGIDIYTLICIKWITNKNLLFKKIKKIQKKKSKIKVKKKKKNLLYKKIKLKKKKRSHDQQKKKAAQGCRGCLGAIMKDAEVTAVP